jgi:hypothetical protein
MIFWLTFLLNLDSYLRVCLSLGSDWHSSWILILILILESWFAEVHSLSLLFVIFLSLLIITYQDFEKCNGIMEVANLIRDKQVDENLRYCFFLLQPVSFILMLIYLSDRSFRSLLLVSSLFVACVLLFCW